LNNDDLFIKTAINLTLKIVDSGDGAPLVPPKSRQLGAR
jgi:hypothetical protein